VALMLVIDLALFGAAGLTVWAVQMAVDPDHRRRHHQRHRPLVGLPQFRGRGRVDQHLALGLIIGGEELHNNHHTYPTSAKLSVKPFEFDIGWGYIRLMEMVGWPGAQDAAALKLGAVKAGGRRQDAGGADRQPLRGDGPATPPALSGAVRAELDA
jgi:stearoyl-CoA desaturase (delta-9 desaturase)